MSLLESSASVLPIVCVGLFAGVQVGIRQSSYPGMVALDDANAVRFFSHFYKPLAAIQPALLAIAALASLLRLTLTTPPSTLATLAHVLVIVHLVFVLGWTLLVMLDDNNRLLKLAADGGSGQQQQKGGDTIRTMLKNWGVRNEARVWPVLVLFVLLVVAETGKH